MIHEADKGPFRTIILVVVILIIVAGTPVAIFYNSKPENKLLPQVVQEPENIIKTNEEDSRNELILNNVCELILEIKKLNEQLKDLNYNIRESNKRKAW